MSETIDNDCDKCGYYGSECECPTPEAMDALKQENARLRDALNDIVARAKTLPPKDIIEIAKEALKSPHGGNS